MTDEAINEGQPGDSGDSIGMDMLPPEVRQWFMEHFQAFRIDGFDMTGQNFEIISCDNTMARYALFESLRRSIVVNDQPTRVVDTTE